MVSSGDARRVEQVNKENPVTILGGGTSHFHFETHEARAVPEMGFFLAS